MKVLEFLKLEFGGFSLCERVLFPIIIIAVCIVSYILNDSITALIAAVSGIICTVLAGKGRISSYIAGIIGTACYSYTALANGFYGNFLLNALYYLPMEIIGIFHWRRHLKKNTREIKKTRLSLKERIIYSAASIILSCMLASAFSAAGGKTPLIDALTTGLSILGQFLTVRRCIEQWYIWFAADFLSLIMWIEAYSNGSNAFAAVLMRLVYTILAVYFYLSWKKDMEKDIISP